MPFSIFRIRTLTGANVVGLLVGASLFSMFFFISLYMQQVLGYSAIHAGLSYLPLALTIIFSAALASQLVTKFGYKPVLAVGLLFIVTGLPWFSQISVGGGFTTDILGPSLLAAAGLGFSFVTTTIAAVSGVEENEAGLASGLINTSQQIGGALGLAVLSTHRDLAHREPAGLRHRRFRTPSPRASRPPSSAAPRSRRSASSSPWS